MATVREVAQSEDTLIQSIDGGHIVAPRLMDYNDWVKWRSGDGRRPGLRKDGHPATTAKYEVDLRKEVYEHIYGEDWRDQLEIAQAEASPAYTGEEEEEPAQVGGAQAQLVPRLTSPSGGIRSLLGGSVSEGGSSSVAATPRGLKRVLDEEFQPQNESVVVWQSRVERAVDQLEKLGAAVSEDDIRKSTAKMKLAQEISGKDLKDQVRHLKQAMGSLLVEEDGMDEKAYNAKVNALTEMLRARGTNLSRATERLFSGTATESYPSPEKAEAEHHVMSPPTTPRTVKELRKEMREMREEMLCRSPAASNQEDVLANAIAMQTEALKVAMTARTQTKSSVIKITPTFRWPTLGDDGPDSKDIEEFYDKYEDLCRLANDGRGMNATEHLTTLASCLRGSKEKIYKLIYMKARKLGTLETDPDAVYDDIRARHMQFTETQMEKQMRVMAEWEALWKGSYSALHFEAVFEEAVAELELAGLGKNQRELLLGYLQKVGKESAAEIQRDVRQWATDVQDLPRRVATWIEAHKVLVEVESMRAGG